MNNKEYSTSDFVNYVVIGTLAPPKSHVRFRQVYTNHMHAMGINLWRGRVWGVKLDGKRVLLKTVTN